MKVRFPAIIRAVHAFLPPKALQRRHHIVKEAGDGLPFSRTGFQGIGQSVQHRQRTLVGTINCIGISPSPDCYVICRWNSDNLGSISRPMQLFFLEIVRHIQSSYQLMGPV